MARAIWKGSISFGLVNIPVGLYAAEARHELSFHLLDKRDKSPVRYKRVSEKSGKEVPWGDIVRGYEYAEGSYVILSDEERLMVALWIVHAHLVYASIEAGEPLNQR